MSKGETVYYEPKVELQHVTPNAEQMILEMARVSSKDPTSKKTGLIGYLIRNKHWSPFEMVNMCVTIECTRDIGRQILRHRSCKFQEFSQRYATVDFIQDIVPLRKARRQDLKNRQNSIDDLPEEIIKEWNKYQEAVHALSTRFYQKALDIGIAKEVARAVLPKGLTVTKMHVNADLRTWIHYYHLRSDNGTQLEHMQIAVKIGELLEEQFPLVFEALKNKIFV